MLNYRTDWGRCEIVLEEYLSKNKISKSSLTKTAELQYTQLQAYCKNIIQRPDLGVLSRICFALNCDVSDLIHYFPPEKPQKED